MLPKKTRTVSERLYFTCWHFCDPEKNLGAALAAGLFVQQPTAFVLVAMWYVVAFWSHTKMVRNFAKRSALDCAARERPEETARIRNPTPTSNFSQRFCYLYSSYELADSAYIMHNAHKDVKYTNVPAVGP